MKIDPHWWRVNFLKRNERTVRLLMKGLMQ